MTSRILPAEWYPQDAVMLTWPHVHSDWAPWLDKVEQLYCQIAKTISEYEDVLIVCYDRSHQQHIQQIIKSNHIDSSKVHFHVVISNDSWARDHGPVTILENNQPRLLDFGFNGWGGKFKATLDDLISQKLFSQSGFAHGVEMEAWPFILEGGSIESDGQGTLLTTEQCLLTPTRNPALSKTDVEQLLHQSLGIKRILWLNKGMLVGDDTDSHIDMLARFCSEDTIAYTSCDDKTDVHYQPLAEMEQQLTEFKTADNKPYKLVSLPMPKAIINDEGDRLPASYANFLIINKAVLVPVYGDDNDELALQRLGECFPGRKVIGINCRYLIEQFGSLHCITMQLPKGVLKK